MMPARIDDHLRSVRHGCGICALISIVKPGRKDAGQEDGKTEDDFFQHARLSFLGLHSQRGSDNPRLIQKLRRHNGSFDCQQRQEFFMLLADAAADNEQVGPE